MKVISMNDRKVDFVNAARTMLGEDRTTITRPEAMLVKEDLGLAGVPSWLKKLKTGNRGEYFLPTADGKCDVGKVTFDDSPLAQAVGETVSAVAMAPQALSVLEEQ